MSLQQTEEECASVAKAPRVALADIEAAIAERYDLNAAEAVEDSVELVLDEWHPLRVLSVCVLVMGNGFTVIGKSAPASPENFNPELGRKLAYEDAVRQIWPLMGFALRDKLHALGTLQPAALKDRPGAVPVQEHVIPQNQPMQQQDDGDPLGR